MLDLVGNQKDRFSHDTTNIDRDCVIREDTEKKEMSITDDALIPLKCGKNKINSCQTENGEPDQKLLHCSIWTTLFAKTCFAKTSCLALM